MSAEISKRRRVRLDPEGFRDVPLNPDRYLDGWQEQETRAGLLFGRAFEPGCLLVRTQIGQACCQIGECRRKSWYGQGAVIPRQSAA